MTTTKSTSDATKVQLVVPVFEAEKEYLTLAPRLSNLEGRTIGLFGNSKECSELFLDRFEQHLSEQFTDIHIKRFRKVAPNIPHADIQELATRCDAVINAISD